MEFMCAGLSGCLWICAALAAPALGVGSLDDSFFLENRYFGSPIAGSIFALVNFCRLSELCGLVAQQIKERSNAALFYSAFDMAAWAISAA